MINMILPKLFMNNNSLSLDNNKIYIIIEENTIFLLSFILYADIQRVSTIIYYMSTVSRFSLDYFSLY